MRLYDAAWQLLAFVCIQSLWFKALASAQMDGQTTIIQDYLGSVIPVHIWLQAYLGFAASKQAMAVVHSFTQAQAARQQQWAMSRLQHAAVLTAVRCAAAPIYGQDLRKVIRDQAIADDTHIASVLIDSLN